MPVQVEEILGKLREHGYEAFAVGGCVRDAILGRIPGDWDITTSAHPEEVKQVFGHTIDTGLQHGTVTVMRDHIGYEITTYRIDGEYEDGRHPKEATKRELSIFSAGRRIWQRAESAASGMRENGLRKMRSGSCVPSAFRPSWDFR